VIGDNLNDMLICNLALVIRGCLEIQFCFVIITLAFIFEVGITAVSFVTYVRILSYLSLYSLHVSVMYASINIIGCHFHRHLLGPIVRHVR